MAGLFLLGELIYNHLVPGKRGLTFPCAWVYNRANNFELSNSGLSTTREGAGKIGAAAWVSHPEMNHILAALMPANRLAVKVALHTGLRIGDVLKLRPRDLRTSRPTIRESKTGKTRRISLPRGLLDELRQISGEYWVFECRTDPTKHRTRQAVYKDIKKAAAVFQRTGAVRRGQVSTHSARKIAAVDAYHKGGLPAAQKLLNHSDPAITALYALADQMGGKKNA